MRRVSLSRAAVVSTVAALGIGTTGTGVAFAGPATAPVVVTCGEVITTSITVANDLTCSGGVALSVQADGVKLNLAGHTISGDGSGVGVEIMPSFSASSPEIRNVTVTNGTLSHFGSAVHLVEAQDPTLSHLTMSDNAGTTDAVIDTRSAAFVDGLLITDSHIDGTQGYVMFGQIEVGALTISHTHISGGTLFLSQSGGPTVTADTFTNTPFTLDIVGDSTITGSKFTNSPVVNDGFGFGHDVFANDTFSGAGTALTLADVADQQLTGNTFTSNNFGVTFTDSPSDTISGNTFSHNRTAGAYFNGAGGPLSGHAPISVSVTGNTAKFNGTHPDGTLDPAGLPVVGGIYLYTPAGGNTVTNNTTAHNGGYGIYALPPNTFSGNVSTGDFAKCYPLNLCTYK